MAYSWLTVHRVRLKEHRNANTDGALPGPSLAAAWRTGPNAPLGENGFRTGVSNEWGGMGFYASRADAETVLSDPSAHLPFLDQTTEAWQALAAGIAHRGEVNWSTASEPHPALEPVDEDPKGVMAVVTSAGYLSRDESQHDRIRTFLKKVDAVVDFYGTLEENAARSLFNLVGTPEGMTFSVWRSDRGMMSSAYREGLHSEYMNMHKGNAMFDRSSFTRLRLLDSSGTWDGIDPREIAQA